MSQIEFDLDMALTGDFDVYTHYPINKPISLLCKNGDRLFWVDDNDNLCEGDLQSGVNEGDGCYVNLYLKEKEVKNRESFMIVKPFDVKEARSGAQLVTAYGQLLFNVCVITDYKNHTIVTGCYEDDCHNETTVIFSDHPDVKQKLSHLFIKPKNVEYWINIFEEDGEIHITNVIYASKEAAQKNTVAPSNINVSQVCIYKKSV